MADLEAMLASLRDAALERGTGWLEEYMRGALPPPPLAAEAPGPRRAARRSRPPERLSPESTPRARRRQRSPSRDPPVPAAGSQSRSGGRAGRNPSRRPSPAVNACSEVSGAPQGSGVATVTAAFPGNPGESSARSALEVSGTAQGVGYRRDRRAHVSCRPSAGPVCSRPLLPAAPAPATRGSRRLGINAIDLHCSSSGRAMESPPSPSGSVDGEYEDDGGECQAPPPALTDVDGGTHRRSDAASTSGGCRAPCPPGTGSAGSNPSSGAASPPAMTSSGVSVSTTGEVSQRGSGEHTTISPGLSGVGGGVGVEGFQAFFRSMQEFFVNCSKGTVGSPADVWAGRVTPAEVAEVPPPSASTTAGSVAEKPVSPAVAVVGDEVRLADAAKGEVYVCFEGPLGAHLKSEVREKIWKGDYVEIFSLLPLEKFNLDRVKPDESKKDEEERRRYRLIPRTFANWMQAFAILASVIGEKAPENCSALFCYLDSIGEAYRVYGGNAWLRYDEQFRQRKAVRPSIRWDHKEISLWMRLMAAPKGAGQPFQGAAGGSGSAAGKSAASGKGCCWQFNEGQCRFGTECRYRHECSGCGGSHSLARCFKKGRNRAGEADQKRVDASDGSKDVTVSKGLSR